MQRAGFQVDETQYGAIITRTPAHTWVEDSPAASEIEQRLWAEYEQRFAKNHERVLAYRYEPATEEETAIVLKYFPPVVVPLKYDRRIEVSYAGIQVTERPERITWDTVTGIQYKESIAGDTLLISVYEKAIIGKMTLKVQLPGIGKEKDQLKEVLGRYWRRHQSMRREQANAAKAEGVMQ